MPDPNPSTAAFSTVVQSLNAQAHLAGDEPSTIGRFRVVRTLGKGAFGRVYLAFDPRLDREVAVKVPLGESGPEFHERFLGEARAAATVSHPNVCPVFEVEADGNTPYLVMRYVAGGTLANLLQRAQGPLHPVAAVRTTKKLALGLAAAHAKGVVHRDLKSANVLYDEANDDVLITDFGLAKLREASDGSLAGIKGTPAYMSPEHVGDGETPGDVGPLSDVYGLGVILFELLTGQLPFRGNPLALMLAHVQKKPDRPSARVAGLDPRLDALCLKALEKAPQNRYASAKAFADALGTYLRHTPGASEDDDIVETAETAYQRGLACACGSEGAPDHARAREWYERAAALDHAGARHALGGMYEDGLGVPRDPAKALELYALAAAQGHPHAQHSLGCFYQHALGVERDYAKAREWYERAAVQGHRGATNALGYLYARGLGVARDDAKASILYELTAAHGADARSDLGCLYLEGVGADAVCVDVRVLYEKAAHGDADAQQALALWLRG